MIKRIEDLNYYELLEVSPAANSQEIHKAYERIRRVYDPNSIALYSLFSPEETAAINQRIEEAYRTLVYEDNRKRYDRMLLRKNELPELDQDIPPIVPQQAPQRAYEAKPEQAPTYQQQPVQPSFSLPSENRFSSLPETPKPVPMPAAPAPHPAAAASAKPVSHFIAEFSGPAIKMLRDQLGLSLRSVADQTKVNARYLEHIEEEHFDKLPARAYIRGFLMLYAKMLGCEPERMAADYLKRYDAATRPPSKK